MPRLRAASQPGLAEVVAGQDGVITRRQLRELGMTDDALRAQLLAQRWQRPTRGVIVTHNGPLSERQRRWVAVLAHEGSALGGVTAAREHGLTGFNDGVVHLLIPHGARVQALDAVKAHRSRRPGDIHPGRSIPTVRVERALVDAASWMRPQRKACAVLAAGVQQRLTTATRLRPELARAGRVKHHALLTHVLADIEGGADSFGEIDLGRLARRAGLAAPNRQVFRLDRAGRRRWLDAEMDGYFVEIDGAVHLKPLRYWDDMDRQNDLVIVTGKPILRFSTVAIRLLPGRVMEQLAAADAKFGSR